VASKAINKVGSAKVGKSALTTRKNLVESIALSLALPELGVTYRYPDAISRSESAVSNVFEVNTAGWWGSTAPRANSALAQTDCLAVLRRVPAAAYIQYFANPTAQTYQYNILGQDIAVLGTGFTDAPPALSFTQLISFPANDYVKYIYGNTNSLTGFNPHGTSVYAGSLTSGPTDARFFWLQNGDQFKTTITNRSGQSITATFVLDYFDPAGGFIKDADDTGSPTTIANNASANVSATAAKPGYYAPRFIASGAVLAIDGQVQFSNNTISGAGDCLGHNPLPGISSNLGAINSLRVLSASIKYTNKASILNKEGQIVAYQLPKGESWFKYVQANSGGFTALVSNAKASITTADNGIFAFLRPTDFKDFEYTEWFRIINGVIWDSFWPIDKPGPQLMVYANVSNFGGQDGYFRFDFGVEYLTTDQWREMKVSEVGNETYNSAMQVVAAMDQVHENPLHISDLFGKIKSVIGKVPGFITKYGPMVSTLASMIGKL